MNTVRGGASAQGIAKRPNRLARTVLAFAYRVDLLRSPLCSGRLWYGKRSTVGEVLAYLTTLGLARRVRPSLPALAERQAPLAARIFRWFVA